MQRFEGNDVSGPHRSQRNGCTLCTEDELVHRGATAANGADSQKGIETTSARVQPVAKNPPHDRGGQRQEFAPAKEVLLGFSRPLATRRVRHWLLSD